MPTDLTPLVVATTNLPAARRAHRWFNNRSILSKITRDGTTSIEVCVPHPSGEGPDQEDLIENTRWALAALLPEGTKIDVVRGPERFAVLARRSGASVFGAAAAICKGTDGREIHYGTMEEAEAEAARLNERVRSPNVRYSAVKL